jgi:hypothetical protein
MLLAVISAMLYISCSSSLSQNYRRVKNVSHPRNIPPLQQLVNSLPTIGRNGLIELRSDVDIPDMQKTIRTLNEVFSFDIRLQKLDRFSQERKQVIVALSSEQAIKRYINHDFGGLACQGYAFAAHAKAFLGSDDAYAWYVAAHELEHVLMARLGATNQVLPVYLSEGIACCVGIHYVIESHMGRQALQEQSAKLAEVNASDVEDTFQNYIRPQDLAIFQKQGKGFLGHQIGGFFVEFLANKTCGSPENFFAEWGDFALELAQTKDLKRTFKKHFGISLKKAQEDFIRYIRETENNPRARFANTPYEGYPKAKPKQRYKAEPVPEQFSDITNPEPSRAQSIEQEN